MQAYLLLLSKKYFRHYTGLTHETWAGIIIYLLESSLMGVFYFLSIYFVNDLHCSVAFAGTIVSFYGIGAIVGGFLGGRLSDRLSPIMVATISLVAQACAYIILIYIKNENYLMADMLVLGGSSYSFITSCQLWVLNQCRDEAQKIQALNLLATASNLGLAISAILVSAFVLYGFKHIFLVTGVGFLMLAFFLHAVHGNNVKSISIERSGASLSSRHNWIILVCVFLIGMIVAQLGTTYAIYIQDTFPLLGVRAVSILFFVNSLLVVLVSAPLGNYFAQYNKMVMVGVSSFLIGFSMFMLILVPLFSFAILACVIYTIGEIVFFSVAQYVCYESGSEDKKGQNLGMFRMVYAASRIAGPMLGGAVYYQAGAGYLWLLCGLVGLLCLVGCVYSSCNRTCIMSNQKIPVQPA